MGMTVGKVGVVRYRSWGVGKTSRGLKETARKIGKPGAR